MLTQLIIFISTLNPLFCLEITKLREHATVVLPTIVITLIPITYAPHKINNV